MEKGNDLKQIEINALRYPAQAEEMVITDNISLESANTFLISIKGMRMQINKAFDPIIKKAHDAHKEALATKKQFDRPLVEAESIIKPQISNYMAELARKQREAEGLAKKAEEERKRKLETAFKADDAGDAEKAEDILKDVTPEAIKAEYTPQPKLEGTSIRKIWKWEVTDLNLIPRIYLQVDSSKIGAAVRSAKGETHISGIRVYSEDSVSIRG